MQDVSIIGIGRTGVGEHWDRPLRDIALEAARAAMENAGLGPDDIDAVVVGNAFGATVSGQTHLSALLADYIGLRGVEALRVEAADASGGIAVRQASMMLNTARTVMVLGVEKVTDQVAADRVTAMTTALDAEHEAIQGATPAALAGLLMRRYMHEHGVELANFEGFSMNAHANGNKNPSAMFRNLIKPGRFASAPMVADPVNLFDGAPEADGAAALILTRTDYARDLNAAAVNIISSAVATDAFSLHDRDDLLFLGAVNAAAGRALEQVGRSPSDVDVLELHDAFTILSALQLEAAGFAERGAGWRLAADGAINLDGNLPISTFGGLKARGNPVGATGVYQVAEVALQLLEQAEGNQITPTPGLGMTLNIGGMGSTAVAHLLARP
jgi:acetyl-CoA C-acetyltransferase